MTGLLLAGGGGGCLDGVVCAVLSCPAGTGGLRRGEYLPFVVLAGVFGGLFVSHGLGGAAMILQGGVFLQLNLLARGRFGGFLSEENS